MASNPDLSKLTVPQLKALCKERRITGYSKLPKAALLQKLTGVAVPARTTLPPNTSQSVATRTNESQNPTRIESSAACHDGDVPNAGRQPVPMVASAPQAPPAQLPELTPNHIVSTREGSTKRPVHTDTSDLSKRIKTSLQPVTNASNYELPLPAPALQEKLPDAPLFRVPELPAQLFYGNACTPSSMFQVPGLPVHPQTSFHGGALPLAKQPSRVEHPIVPRQATGATRFKPLIPVTLKPVEPDPANRELLPRLMGSIEPSVASTALGFNLRVTPPVLSCISFPPRAAERKWVNQWAIILSALSPADRKICVFVSRTFRYAVYLSAAYILPGKFPGRRLDTLFEQYPKNMTNFWPYLQFRSDEVSQRRRAFNQSFLGQYTNVIGYDPLSVHLWTSPDDEKQVDIALRFVLTRMWFATSVGAYGHDASKWSTSTIQDVCEIVRGEIWQVIVQDKGTVEMGLFYVLEATCEVIGQCTSTLGYSLRADWTSWIAERSRGVPGPRSLLELVKWSNTEDYYCGVSKAWLCRVRGQDVDNVSKRRVAERYIFASVVANGISGQWMSTNAMAQEFAGLPATDGAHGSRTAGRSKHTVNMYLAAHHHIESVHFTTSKGETLHGAVAVVQTPGREYYVLRDNGMQVGCEEEGIPEVWQQIIGCDVIGRPRSLKSL